MMNRLFQTYSFLPKKAVFLLIGLFSVVLTSEADVGDTFTAAVGNVDMQFKVISDTEVQVGDGRKACIPTSTSGTIVIPSTVYSIKHEKYFTVTKIGRYALVLCGNLTKLIVPDTVTEIDDSALDSCTGLTSLVLPNTVTRIGDEALILCRSLTSLTLPSGLKELGDHALDGCKGITSLALPASLESTDYSFPRMTGLTKFSVYSGNPYYSAVDGVLYRTENGQKALEAYPVGKEGTSFTVPDDVTELADGAFNSSELVSLTLPDGLTTIGGAFDCCEKLTSITIPAGVTSLTNNGFFDCTSLKTVTLCNGDIASAYHPELFSTIADGATLIVPQEYLSLYQCAPWQEWFDNIEGYDMLYPLWVNGEQVTSSQASSLPVNSGSANYDPATKTLTLNNAVMNSYEGNTMYCIANGNIYEGKKGIDGLKIVVNGNCRLKSDDISMMLNGGSTTITGTGQLHMESDHVYGIWLDANTTLTLQDAYVDVTGWNAILGKGVDENCVLNVNHSTLWAQPHNGFCQEITISGLTELNLKNSRFANSGDQGYDDPMYFNFEWSNGCVTYDRDPYYYSVYIEPYEGTPSALTSIADATTEQSADYYNLQGVRVGKPSHSGIYIRDGKKVVVR